MSVALHALNWPLAVSFVGCGVLLGTIFSAGSLVLEAMTFHHYGRIRETLLLFLYAFLENFGYRQLHVAWRCLGLGDFLTRREQWHQAARRAF